MVNDSMPGCNFPISAMIVGFNEAHFLKDCLSSVSFCDEIYYTDLGSSDNSLQIAGSFGAIIQHHSMVPSCEMVQTKVVSQIKNDWVIFIDPDERVDPLLAEEIKKNFESYLKDDKLGAVMVPWVFYFKKHRLKGTVWGGTNEKYFLVNKKRFEFEPVVHYGRKILPGFHTIHIDADGGKRVLHHYWMNSYRIFFRKHFRYLKNEGIDRYNYGVRQSIRGLCTKPFKAFNESFFVKKGYKDFHIGLFLSAFWAFYETWIAFDLVRIQRKKKKQSKNLEGPAKP